MQYCIYSTLLIYYQARRMRMCGQRQHGLWVRWDATRRSMLKLWLSSTSSLPSSPFTRTPTPPRIYRPRFAFDIAS